jgi:exosome complex exonuclease RRP6
MDYKPQTAWYDVTENKNRVFVPKLKTKLNAREPLDPRIVSAQGNSTAPTQEFDNPYIVEINCDLVEKLDWVMKAQTPGPIPPFKSIEQSRFVYIDNDQALDMMIDDIVVNSKDVAIDLEHHDLRSFLGFTCLIQISTRDTDYLIDPFNIFKSIHRINRFTTDPRILKVMHSAEGDIEWLQRDFGVYVVSLFDTAKAGQALVIPGGYGLSSLLQHFCKVVTDKSHQMADWRPRPLTQSMLQYARTDTHYLLYIKDRLFYELFSNRLLFVEVWEKSSKVASRAYQYPSHDIGDSYIRKYLKKQKEKLDLVRIPHGERILAGILKWRIETASRLDESCSYVLENGYCMRVANSNPSSGDDILKCVGRKLSRSMANELYRYISRECL